MNKLLSKNRVFVMAAGVAAIAFLLFVWPTPYRYDRIVWTEGRSIPTRTSRITGKAEWLIPGAGWVPMKLAESSKPDELKSLLPFDRGAIDVSQLRWRSTGFIKGPIYNPTSYRLNTISLWIELFSKKDKSKVLERVYQQAVNIAPRAVGDILFDAGFEWKPEYEWQVKLIEAKGAEEVKIKTARDFIEWKLPGLLRDPAFLGLPVEERRKAADQFAKGRFAEDFPDFKALSNADQAIVVEYLKNQK